MALEAEGGLGNPTPKKTMLVGTESGRLYSVDFTENPQIDDPGLIDWDISISKILIGKIQTQRTRWITLDNVEFENTVRTEQLPPGSSTDLEISVFNSLDGKNAQSAVTLVPANEAGGLISLPARLTGQNFSVQLRGVFNLNTLVITSHLNGRR